MNLLLRPAPSQREVRYDISATGLEAIIRHQQLWDTATVELYSVFQKARELRQYQGG